MSRKQRRKLKEVKAYLPGFAYQKLKELAGKNLSAYLRNLIIMHLQKVEKLEGTELPEPGSSAAQKEEVGKTVLRSITEYEKRAFDRMLRLCGEVAYELGNIARHLTKCPAQADMLKFYRRVVQMTGVLHGIMKALDTALETGKVPYVEPEKITVQELHLKDVEDIESVKTPEPDVSCLEKLLEKERNALMDIASKFGIEESVLVGGNYDDIHVVRFNNQFKIVGYKKLHEDGSWTSQEIASVPSEEDARSFQVVWNRYKLLRDYKALITEETQRG